jgi:hypothetical protein
MTEWNAYFTPGLPHGAITDLLVTFDARERPEADVGGPEVVLTALSARGWIQDMDRPQGAATDPGFCSCVSLEMVPSLIQDADPRPDLVGWQAWAEPVLGARTCGVPASAPASPTTCSPSSPHRSPHPPVPRRTLPKSAEGRLNVIRRR